MQHTPIGGHDRGRSGLGSDRIDRHDDLRFDGTTIDFATQVIGDNADQTRRSLLVQLIPPSRFGSFANVCFVTHHDFIKLISQSGIKALDNLADLRDQFGSVILERADCDLASQRATEHHNLKRTELTWLQPFAFKRFEHTDQPAATTLARRDFLLLLGNRFRRLGL